MEMEIKPDKKSTLEFLANIRAQHSELELKVAKLKSLSLHSFYTRPYLFQLNVLIGYVSAHFATEEQLMQHFDYLMFINHQQKHKDFLISLTNFSNDIVEGNLSNLNDVTKFLEFWFEEHDLDFDIALVTFMTKMAV